MSQNQFATDQGGEGQQLLVAIAGAGFGIGKEGGAVHHLEQGQIGIGAHLESPLAGQAQGIGGMVGDAGQYLLQGHADGEKLRHHVGQAVDRPLDAVLAVDVGADGAGQDPLGNGQFRDLEAEAGAAVADVEQETPLHRLTHRLAQLAGRGQDAIGLAVEAVGQQIAIPQQGDDLVQIRRRVAHVYHQRQPTVGLLQCLGHAQRLQAVLTHHAAAHPRLDADDEAGVAGNGRRGEIHIEVPAVGQLVLAQQADARDVEQGVHPGLAAGGETLEVIHVVGPGAAGVDDGGDAGLNAHLVRFIVIEGGGGVAVGVAVDPAGAHMHPAAEIQGLLRHGRLWQGAEGGDFALLDGDIDELAISLAPRSDDDVVHADGL